MRRRAGLAAVALLVAGCSGAEQAEAPAQGELEAAVRSYSAAYLGGQAEAQTSGSS
jgi:hypothetical protein